ncbi:hypothetical protein NC653_041038 [Populus alba x Populus x berolinensis]|uniref:HTH myb-type domain-containing protein n=1 Tax=Populus alba x Populus x berolinensis TaxID=444605 RepID=A0AAD6L7I8_9ROSI|nr:hypothetical protein NC653_041038 [Populus alba x Populus x berolinensis]
MRNLSSTTSTRSRSCTYTVVLLARWASRRGHGHQKRDELLANYVRKEGDGRWRTLPKRAGLLRCGKSCRLPLDELFLRPSVKRGRIDPDEEDLILRLHRLLGNSKKLISQGIDPRTHKPLKPKTDSLRNCKCSQSKNSNPISSPQGRRMGGSIELYKPLDGYGRKNDDDFIEEDIGNEDSFSSFLGFLAQ